jgi:hypothetical protein
MLEVISTRRAIHAQWTVVRVRGVQLLRQRHRLTAAITQFTRSQRQEQSSADLVVHGVVATSMPVATRCVLRTVAGTGALGASGVGPVG